VTQVLALVALLSLGLSGETGAGQNAWGVNELAEYRLTVPVFTQFGHASHLIAVATGDDLTFIRAPLFTKEVALSGEVQAMAIALEARLTHEPLLAAALRDAGMTAHDYTKFSLVLIAARFAHEFVAAGIIRSVPAGAAASTIATATAPDAKCR
jgi:hypothetical protein